MKAAQIVEKLLEETDWVRALIGEASVHLPRRGKNWVASFTGLHGQEWRTTGTADRAVALARAREFEAAARVQKANAARTGERRMPAVRQSTGRPDRGLTQREVALLLAISERAVRAIEKRALRKLARHPGLRELWRQFLAGELSEQVQLLSAPEINALLRMTRSPAERVAVRKALELVQTDQIEGGPESQTPPTPGINTCGTKFSKRTQ